MDKIPILKIGRCLLVSIQEDMDDSLVLNLQDNLTERIAKYHIEGVLIDISLLDIVDSFIGRMLGIMSVMSHILGAQTVIVGMQPAVAITIIELGLNLKDIQTAINVEQGMALLGVNNSGSKNTIDERADLTDSD